MGETISGFQAPEKYPAPAFAKAGKNQQAPEDISATLAQMVSHVATAEPKLSIASDALTSHAKAPVETTSWVNAQTSSVKNATTQGPYTTVDSGTYPVRSEVRITYNRKDVLEYIKLMTETSKAVRDDFVKQLLQAIEHSELDDLDKVDLTAVVMGLEVVDYGFEKFANNPLFEAAALSQEVLAGTPEVAQFKNMVKDAGSTSQAAVQTWAKNVLQSLKTSNCPQSIQDQVKKFEQSVPDLFGQKQFAFIHAHKNWDPKNPLVRFTAIVNPDTGEASKVTSTIRAAGPGYSSQAPRNRTAQEAVLANFFDSELQVQDVNVLQGQWKNNPVVSGAISRSAIPVEFSQKDDNERMRATQSLVKQELDHQAENALRQYPSDVLAQSSKEHPITIKTQNITLLTPDAIRAFLHAHPAIAAKAVKVSKGLSGASADDERTLALESQKAHEFWNDAVQPYQFVDEAGKTVTAWVKYDCSYMNIPCNVLSAKLPGSLLHSDALLRANNAAWAKLKNESQDAIQNKMQALRKEIDALTNPDKSVALEAFAAMQQAVSERQKACDFTKAKGFKAENAAFKNWQVQSEKLNDSLNALQQQSSNGLLQAVHAIREIKMHQDLLLDTAELYENGLSKDVKNMDNNRAALAARLIVLSTLSSRQLHFGCRSGKDRTGIVDSEWKLLCMYALSHGRIPSYREQEQIKQMWSYREQAIMEFGNTDVVEMVQGANIGLNTSGSMMDPLEENELNARLEKEMQAAAKIAMRPKTAAHTTVPAAAYNQKPIFTAVTELQVQLKSFADSVQTASGVDVDALDREVAAMRASLDADKLNPEYRKKRALLELAETELSHLKFVRSFAAVMQDPEFLNKFPQGVHQSILSRQQFYTAIYEQNKQILETMVHDLQASEPDRAIASVFQSQEFSKLLDGMALAVQMQHEISQDESFAKALTAFAKSKYPREAQDVAKFAGQPGVPFGQRLGRLPLLLDAITKGLSDDERKASLAALINHPALQSMKSI